MRLDHKELQELKAKAQDHLRKLHRDKATRADVDKIRQDFRNYKHSHKMDVHLDCYEEVLMPEVKELGSECDVSKKELLAHENKLRDLGRKLTQAGH